VKKAGPIAPHLPRERNSGVEGESTKAGHGLKKTQNCSTKRQKKKGKLATIGKHAEGGSTDKGGMVSKQGGKKPPPQTGRKHHIWFRTEVRGDSTQEKRLEGLYEEGRRKGGKQLGNVAGGGESLPWGPVYVPPGTAERRPDIVDVTTSQDSI